MNYDYFYYYFKLIYLITDIITSRVYFKDNHL